MPLSRTIAALIARAANTSAIDDDALDKLGCNALETVAADPATPTHLRDAVVRLLAREIARSSSVRAAPDDQSS